MVARSVSRATLNQAMSCGPWATRAAMFSGPDNRLDHRERPSEVAEHDVVEEDDSRKASEPSFVVLVAPDGA